MAVRGLRPPRDPLRGPLRRPGVPQSLPRSGLPGPGARDRLVFDPEFWGRGIATEAALAVRDEAFRLATATLFARCHPDNRPSKRIMGKLGMTFHGTGPPVRRAVPHLPRPGPRATGRLPGGEACRRGQPQGTAAVTMPSGGIARHHAPQLTDGARARRRHGAALGIATRVVPPE